MAYNLRCILTILVQRRFSFLLLNNVVAKNF